MDHQSIPDFIQIFGIGSEGYDCKEVHLLVEEACHICVYEVKLAQIQWSTPFILNLKFKFNKFSLGVGVTGSISSMCMLNISETENIYLLTKQDGAMKLLT